MQDLILTQPGQVGRVVRTLDDDTVKLILDTWNAMAKASDLPTARAITGGRLTRLRARVKDHGVQAVLDAIAAVPRSRFLCGDNDSGWRADFDFLVQDKSFGRVIEGFYERLRKKPTSDRFQERATTYSGGAINAALDRVAGRQTRGTAK